MTDTDRPLCDCPEPCGCYVEGYAAGKDKAYFETLAGKDKAYFETLPARRRLASRS